MIYTLRIAYKHDCQLHIHRVSLHRDLHRAISPRRSNSVYYYANNSFNHSWVNTSVLLKKLKKITFNLQFL